MPRNTPLTDAQKASIAEAYKLNREAGMTAQDSERLIANEHGISARTVRVHRGFNILTASDSAISKEMDAFVKGTSTLYDENGEVKLRWVKTDKKFDAEQAREWLTALAAKVPRAKPTAGPGILPDDTLTVIPMGDPHLGLYSWAAESGDDFDLNIAERDLCNAVDRLVRCTPKSKQALIVNLGDFFHSDNMLGETTRGHHKLDTDTRWAKVLVVGLKAIRQCITSALEHHEQVTVINAIGNHDDHSSMFLTVALSNIYEDCPRVKIIDNPTVVHYYHFGQNLIGVHHGHSIKAQDLPLIMAADRPKEWAESKHRIWLCGHIHHDTKKEYQGVTVETFRTLAARDAWAASKGYKSGRDMKALILHREFGEIERHTVSVDMLRDDKHQNRNNE